MRVTCNSIGEFLQELVVGQGEEILQKAIRVSISKNALGSSYQDDPREEVTIHASALILLPDNAEYLLEAGESCGFNIHDSTQDFAGSDKAEQLKDLIRGYCTRHNLVVRSGVIEP